MTDSRAPRWALLLALLLALPGALSAQSFGRNKVSYKVIDFSVLKTDHFQIYHYPREAPPVLDAAHLLERWYAIHADLLGFGLGAAQKVILYDSFSDFQQANAVPGLISAGEGGVTESFGGRILIPLTGIPADDNHVLGHELVHAFQFSAMRSATGLSAAAVSLPTWFVEGMAEYLSLGPRDPLTAMWMRDAQLTGDMPGIEEIGSRPDLYFPYRFGAAAWAFIERKWGRAGLRDFFNEAAVHGVQSALVSELHVVKPSDFTALWKEDLAAVYGPGLAGRASPRDVGRTLDALGGRTNLGPAISPDGRFIAVFSQRDPFTFSLTLVDAVSGRAMRTLGSTGTDVHFDSLHFVNASGGWSADSRHFAFPVQRDGRDAIAIAEIPGGRIERVIDLPGISDVSGIAWSPEDDRLVLSGTRDAVGGLWLLQLATGDLKRLTQGRGAFLQPAWSPDGATIAFATDYGPKTDRTALVYGSMNIGLMDVQSGSIRILSLRDGAAHIDPQYSPDGRSIYFVGSPEGSAGHLPLQPGHREVLAGHPGGHGNQRAHAPVTMPVGIPRHGGSGVHGLQQAGLRGPPPVYARGAGNRGRFRRGNRPAVHGRGHRARSRFTRRIHRPVPADLLAPVGKRGEHRRDPRPVRRGFRRLRGARLPGRRGRPPRGCRHPGQRQPSRRSAARSFT